ncbi:hypothetical protein [Amycolatopsis sp. NPDC004079]|uniref:hypothetical protein n=1 Tax=Amycolatopsis sp. NPDC004079 TaxID=3154549 RepID=UPI0033B6B778
MLKRFKPGQIVEAKVRGIWGQYAYADHNDGGVHWVHEARLPWSQQYSIEDEADIRADPGGVRLLDIFDFDTPAFGRQPHDDMWVTGAWNPQTRSWDYYIKVIGMGVQVFSEVGVAQEFVDSHGNGAVRNTSTLEEGTRRCEQDARRSPLWPPPE